MKFANLRFVAILFICGGAVAAWSTAAEPAPTANDLEQRGSDLFRQAKFADSVAAFDAEIALDPRRAPWHWKRGISLYYAGRYLDGAKQFEGYQTVDGNDVENAVWRFLCQARDPVVGLARARREILTIKDDRRVPMMQVYALFKGDLQPDDVLQACKADQPSPEVLDHRLFYAHLYLGLYAEALGDQTTARRHLDAAEKLAITHYMGDVAKVHAQLLRKGAE